MTVLRACVHYIDIFTEHCGRLLAWLVLAMALLTTAVVVLRYGFNTGSIMAQEAITYMHGCLFMLAAAYALKSEAHVRVDIFYRNFSPRGQAWVNSVGGIIFLMPLCAFIGFSSWNYVAESWAIREVSPEPGGIPAVFLLKSLLPLMAANLFLQGLAETLRGALVLVAEPRA
ncbi:MAG: TRAP transporter small permease subunit [Pseudomonadales bacterium]|nr:TRAP transporter small permease subunit [Halieaceae bacterium]MCP5163576.1 TRAP transporter small permease subunit [Pseudomonadales bacterium]MCP5189199.1 TRAP transporter small permease subunit [Pseudomonadales bacterium]MCP5204540.1 TRAP transporter small permease subunit [Pseudomonadales bacterium]